MRAQHKHRSRHDAASERAGLCAYPDSSGYSGRLAVSGRFQIHAALPVPPEKDQDIRYRD